MSELSAIDRAKRAAGRHAAGLVEDGMRVGLGTGSTAKWLIERLGERVRDEGMGIRAVPTSTATATLAEAQGIELSDLNDLGRLDLTIDGADELDARLSLIKGGGGALLREKIVAAASDRMVVIADAAKHVATLGAFPLPVELIPFGWRSAHRLIEDLLADSDVMASAGTLRMDGDAPFLTDEGNVILDLALRRIGDPARLEAALNRIPGVVENGIFTGLADIAILGHTDGSVEVLDPATGTARREAPADAGQDGAAEENVFRA